MRGLSTKSPTSRACNSTPLVARGGWARHRTVRRSEEGVERHEDSQTPRSGTGSGSGRHHGLRGREAPRRRGGRRDRRGGGRGLVRAGSAADRAALTLCRLRRARAGELGGMGHGDEAVRDALGRQTPMPSSGLRAGRSRTSTNRASPRPWSNGTTSSRLTLRGRFTRSARADRDSRTRCRRGG